MHEDPQFASFLSELVNTLKDDRLIDAIVQSTTETTATLLIKANEHDPEDQETTLAIEWLDAPQLRGNDGVYDLPELLVRVNGIVITANAKAVSAIAFQDWS